jgi:hypothetical protein
MKTEPAFCEALSFWLEAATNLQEIRFLVALYMTALRVALEEWLEQETQGDLVSLLRGYLDAFSSLSRHAWTKRAVVRDNCVEKSGNCDFWRWVYRRG